VEDTIADELRIGLSELLHNARMGYGADFLKEDIRVLCQVLIEMEIEEHVGAARHEPSAGRVGQRNGYRGRSYDTRVETLEGKRRGEGEEPSVACTVRRLRGSWITGRYSW
jgi:hypothetical protein